MARHKADSPSSPDRLYYSILGSDTESGSGVGRQEVVLKPVETACVNAEHKEFPYPRSVWTSPSPGRWEMGRCYYCQ